MKKLNEYQCIQSIHEYLKECDADELARLTGELFGGDCFSACDENNICFYDFTPNEYYSGEFNNIKDK